jgi:hypothetical protein
MAEEKSDCESAHSTRTAAEKGKQNNPVRRP